MCKAGRGQGRGRSRDAGGASLGALRDLEWGLPPAPPQWRGELRRGSKVVVGRGPGRWVLEGRGFECGGGKADIQLNSPVHQKRSPSRRIQVKEAKVHSRTGLTAASSRMGNPDQTAVCLPPWLLPLSPIGCSALHRLLIWAGNGTLTCPL